MQCVHARTVYTGREAAEDLYLLFDGSRIKGLSAVPEGEVVGRFAALTPAFIDPHSHIGMSREGEPRNEAESNETMDAILALADALDSVQMDDLAFRESVEMGVLYSCAVPGSGNIIGGMSAVIRHYAATSTEAFICRAGVKGAFGYNPMSTREWKGTRPSTRMGALSLLRHELRKVQQKVERQHQTPSTPDREAPLSGAEKVLAELLSGRLRLRAHVHKTDDIAALLRLVDEFGLRITVEHAMDVHQPGIFAELGRRRIPVVYGPVDAFAYKVELKHKDWRNVRHLVGSGVEYGLMTDHPVTPSRQLFLQTRWFTRAGASRTQAISLVSLGNARILGIDRVLGSLEPGKWASFVGWNGDPFDMTCFPVAVYGEGKLLYAQE
ncbi:MAG: amidohydrolase family protein [Candidatus Latescibacterota bacterium]